MREAAFSLDNHDAVAAYIAAAEAGRAAGMRAVEDAKTLGHNEGPAVTRGMWNMPDSINGLFPADPTEPPAGWVYVQRWETLCPQRGKAGDPARAWIADHPLCADPRAALEQYGLPHYSASPHTDSSRYVMARPNVFHHAGVLWARYEGAVDGDCLWMPQPLSAFHTALEAGRAALEVADRG